MCGFKSRIKYNGYATIQVKPHLFETLPCVTAYVAKYGDGKEPEDKSKEKPFALIQQALLQHCLLPRLYVRRNNRHAECCHGLMAVVALVTV